MTQKHTPKFLSKSVAEESVALIVKAVDSGHEPFHRLKRVHMHIVIMVPSMPDDGPLYDMYPNYPLDAYVLYEHSIGNPNEWEHDYKDIACCKALQLWHNRNDGGCTIHPHLLFPGDAPFYGGVKREGIVVTCSGVQLYFDRMIAGMVADMCIAIAHDEWEKSDDKKQGRDNLL